MVEENVERLEYLRYIIIKKKRQTSQLLVTSEKELKEKEDRLEKLEAMDFLILEQLRKILY